MTARFAPDDERQSSRTVLDENSAIPMPFAPVRTGERLGGAEAGIAAPENCLEL